MTCVVGVYTCLYKRFIPKKTATLTLPRRGNSLAVGIPSSIAESAGFKVGQPVEVLAPDLAMRVVVAGEPRLALKQKLASFDPERHGGEGMAAVRPRDKA